MYYLNAEDCQLAALAFNEEKGGTPIVFLHGVLLSYRFWEAILPDVIKNQIRWYSLSLPGHYPALLPSQSPEHLAPDRLAQTLDTAIHQLVGNQPVTLVGYSTGGFAALTLGALKPKRVKAILCISGFSQGQWHGVLGLLQKLSQGNIVNKLLFKAILYTLTLNKSFYRLASGMIAGDRRAYFSASILNPTIDAIYPDLVQQNLNTMLYFFNRMATIDITALLAQIEAPTEIVTGDRDSIIPCARAQLLAKSIPNAKLNLVKGMGHMFFAERTETFHRILIDWLEQTLLQPIVSTQS